MTPLTIPAAILEDARTFFEDCGARGCEGTALIAASGDVATRLVIPNQAATPAPYCSVEVTRAGKLSLAAALGPGDRYAARIHSHPLLAFHSPTDDANPAITQEGAFSIVAPYFGLGLRHGLDPCAVYIRTNNTWTELPAGGDREDRIWVA